MVLPKPEEGENKEEFLERCLRDEEVLEDFGDNDQAFAVCNRLFEDDEEGKSNKVNKMNIGKYAFVNEKYWMADPEWLNRALSAMKSFSEVEKKSLLDFFGRTEANEADDLPFTLLPNGVAILNINGAMQKQLDFFSFIFGGTSTVNLRQSLDIAMNDSRVKGALLVVDSGGGAVSGTNELANDIKAFGAVKPINAFIEDLGASAAFWVSSQTSFISANETAEIGSIGTVAVIEDFSEMFEKQGVKVHVVSTGEFKGAFVPGSEVTKEQVAELQRNVNALNEVFQNAVSTGRDMSRDDLARVSDGRVFIASEAVELGLIDTIETIEDAIIRLSETIRKTSRSNANRARALIELHEDK